MEDNASWAGSQATPLGPEFAEGSVTATVGKRLVLLAILGLPDRFLRQPEAGAIGEPSLRPREESWALIEYAQHDPRYLG
jgi:hypothetical protein